MQHIRPFLNHQWPSLLVAAILLAVAIYSSLNLVTTPRLWVDEALTIEMSRNLATQGVLDIQVAPGIFSGTPQYLQSTGYTVTYPLALVFTAFRVGAVQERIYMLVWLLCTLLMTYLVLRSVFGSASALGGILLLSSFATLYADGRTATGEAPGFFFLMAGIYFLSVRSFPLVAGLLWGLAIVTKPSVYLLLIPAVTLAVILQREKKWANKIRTLIQIGIGALGPILVWFALTMPDVGNSGTWANLAAFYRNPYGTGVAPSLMQNLVAAVHSATIIYFSVWIACIAIARKYLQDARQLFFYNFVLLYSAFAFLYYLRSPGWLRYIFAGELLVLALLPQALGILGNAYRRFWPQPFWNKEVPIAITLIVLAQLVQLSFFSHMFSSGQTVRVADYINTHEPQASVLAFQALNVSALLITEQRYNSVTLTGIPVLDTNPLSNGVLPDIVIGTSDNPHIIESRALLEQQYRLQLNDEDMLVYRLINR